MEQKWMPIETAPKCGTYILVWNGESMTVCRWAFGCWTLAQTGSWSADDECYGPTHWMPLPKPPTEENDG